MRRVAIVAGDAGQAVFGYVEVPGVKHKGKGEEETRPVCDFGDWHTAEKETATILYVIAGKWTVEVHGETREFGPGSVVVSQDGAVPKEKGHRSRSAGDGDLILAKLTVDHLFEIVA